jgi:hypothetical protein
MSGVSVAPSVVPMEAAMETRVVPDAFRRAEAVRGVGLALTRTLSAISGVLIGVLVVAVYVAAGLIGDGAWRYLPGLAVAAALGGYTVAAPSVFAQLTRATTARGTGARLMLVVATYAGGWAALLWVLDRS